MILNELPGSISKPDEFKKRDRSGEDCGHEWVSIPKFCGKLVRTGCIKVKQEYQQQIFLCRKIHVTILDVIRLYPIALEYVKF